VVAGGAVVVGTAVVVAGGTVVVGTAVVVPAGGTAVVVVPACAWRTLPVPQSFMP
jgi:hypothetical protein